MKGLVWMTQMSAEVNPSCLEFGTWTSNESSRDPHDGSRQQTGPSDVQLIYGRDAVLRGVPC